jgi:trehalose/maltose transport system substrate-binding protein
LRFRIFLLLFALGFGLVGCENTAPPPAENTPLKLAVPSWYSPEKLPLMGEALVRFAQTRQIQVEPHVMFGKRDAMLQKLMLGAKRGDFADVALVRNEWLGPLRAAGVLKALPTGLAGWVGEAIVPGILPAVREGGTVWAVPFDLDALVIWYRRDLAEAAGQKPGLDWKVADFEALIEALSTKRPAFGFSAANYGNAGLSFLPWYFSRGGTIETGDGLKLQSGPAAATLGWLQSLAERKFAPATTPGLQQADVFSGLAGGKYALTIGGTWSRGMLREQSELGEKIACLPIPATPENEGLTVLGGWSLALLSDKPGGADLAGLLAGESVQRAKLKAAALLPAHRDVFNDGWFADDPDGVTFLYALEHGRALPLSPDSGGLLERVAQMQSAVLLGEKTPAEAVEIVR